MLSFRITYLAVLLGLFALFAWKRYSVWSVVYITDGYTPVMPTPGCLNTVMPTAALHHFSKSELLMNYTGRFFKPTRNMSYSSTFTAIMLLISGIELNPGPALSCGVLNARSVIHRGPLIQDLISSKSLDVMAISETWTLKEDPDTILLDVAPPGYSVLHVPRPDTTSAARGGGLCFVFREDLTVKPHRLHHKLRHTSFELQLLHVSDSAKNKDPGVVIANIYRPPKSSLPIFLDELSDLFTDCANYIQKDRFIACGDFNSPGDPAGNASVNPVLMTVFDIHGLTQHVSEPTRSTESTSNILDLVVSRDTQPSCVRDVRVCSSHHISDHELVTFSLNCGFKQRRCVIQYEFRNFKRLNVALFRTYLLASELFHAPASTTVDYANQIDSVLTKFIDKYCPLQTRSKFASAKLGGYRLLSAEAVKLKRKRRKLERKWKKLAERIFGNSIAQHVV